MEQLKASDIRDVYAQKKYREQSKSKDKAHKDCAHYFSLEIAVFLNQFVDPPVSPGTLKHLCNDKVNLRMVSSKSNKSTHRDIDNVLMKQFQFIVDSKFRTNPKYEKLLSANPSKLVESMQRDSMSPIPLKGTTAQRAIAQTKKVQKLPFPNHYVEFTRLFYRCFSDNKGRAIWKDSRNRMEFKMYLKARMRSDHVSIDHEDDDHKEHKREDMVIGRDRKNRTLYRGSKGGVYYLTKSGGKRYVGSHSVVIEHLEEDEERDPRLMEAEWADGLKSESMSNEFGVDEKGRRLYRGKRGGIYRLTRGGKKCYVKSESV